MVRRKVEKDMGYVDKYFAAQEHEPVNALILEADGRFNQPLIELALRHFHLDPRPVLQSNEERIYLSPERRLQAIANYENFPRDTGFVLAPASPLDPARFSNRELLWTALPNWPRQYFNGMTPRPWKIFAQYGIAEVAYAGRRRLLASPDTKLWFKTAPGRREVVAECAIVPGAYADDVPVGDRTDGVEFAICEVGTDGTIHTLATLFLNPARVPADRGVHVLKFTGEIAPGADIRLETRPGPNGSYARDWALLGPVTIR